MNTPSAVTATMCGRETVTLSDGRVLFRPKMAHMIAVETIKNNGVFDAKSNVSNIVALMLALGVHETNVLEWARGLDAEAFGRETCKIDFAMFSEIEKAVNELFAPMQTLVDAAGSGGAGNHTAATGGLSHSLPRCAITIIGRLRRLSGCTLTRQCLWQGKSGL